MNRNNLETADLVEAMEMYILAIAKTMPNTLNDKIANQLQDLSQNHRAKSDTAGKYALTLADLIRKAHPTMQ